MVFSRMSELMGLVEQEIPEGRSSLQESHANLERVAEYCETKYFQVENKRAALEETKNYTTQSLASVAYQINTLAYNFLQMLDLQTTQMAEMESNINHIAEMIMIHKEKVARREIGILTTNKNNARQHRIIAPANQERPIKYIRKPIDYSALDDVGHGVRIGLLGHVPRSKRGPSGTAGPGGNNGVVSASGSLINGGGGGGGGAGGVPPPTTKPPTPPQSMRSGSLGGGGGGGGGGGMGSAASTLGRSGSSSGGGGGGGGGGGSRDYRTLAPPVAPPQVPSNYAPNYPIGHPRAVETLRRGISVERQTSGYGTLPNMSHHSMMMMMMGGGGGGQQQQQPQVGMVHPMAHGAGGGGGGEHHPHHQQQQQQPPPPSPVPPPPAAADHHLGHSYPQQGGGGSHMPAPPTPPPPTSADYDRMGNASPPLPPPPEDDHALFMANYTPPSPSTYAQDSGNSAWVPASYIEKVVAIYDYVADKDDELSFSENSLIYVVKKNDDGWYEGVMDGVTGLFPGNYVEPCL